MADLEEQYRPRPFELYRNELFEKEPEKIYHYTPLNHKCREIRLLSLLPGKFNQGMIECIIRTVSLDEKPKYSALSYSWGPWHEDIGGILLHGLIYPISIYLLDALQYLRSETEVRVFWVDALCMDQVDPEEKSQQVGQMREIFRSALRTYIFLDHPGHDSDLAMDFLSTIQNLDVDGLNNYQVDITDDMRKTLLGLYMLLRRPWWERVWILQEAAVASSDPLVGCGHKWIPFGAFQKLLTLIKYQTGRTTESAL